MEQSPGLVISFWLLALAAIGSALAVVLLRNIFRAGLFLVFCFFTVAGLYITLGADFLAAVQVLIYVGAVGVLILLAIMLTREYQVGSPFARWRLGAAILVILLLGGMVWVVAGTGWKVAKLAKLEPTTAPIAQALFNLDKGFVLPFEIASVLLLAAVIGAIVLVREK